MRPFASAATRAVARRSYYGFSNKQSPCDLVLGGGSGGHRCNANDGNRRRSSSASSKDRTSYDGNHRQQNTSTSASSTTTNAGSIVDPAVAEYLSSSLSSLQQEEHDDAQQQQLYVSIVRALEPAYGKPLQVSHLQAFGPAALQALVTSIIQSSQQQQQSQDDNKSSSNPADTATSTLSKRISVHVPHWGKNCTYDELEWKGADMSLLHVCQGQDDLQELLQGTCGGNMSCCTCHVYLSPQLYKAASSSVGCSDDNDDDNNDDYGQCYPTEAELDMLDLAYDVKVTSRLACQVYLTEHIVKDVSPEDMVVTIPSDVNDLWS